MYKFPQAFRYENNLIARTTNMYSTVKLKVIVHSTKWFYERQKNIETTKDNIYCSIRIASPFGYFTLKRVDRKEKDAYYETYTLHV